MSDPFAALDPMQKSRLPSNGASTFTSVQKPVVNPFDAFSNVSPGATAQAPQQTYLNSANFMTQQSPTFNDGSQHFMTQQGPPAFGGLGGSQQFMTQQGLPAFGGLGQSQQFATFNPYQQQVPAPAPVMMLPPQYQNQSNAPPKLIPMPTYGGEPIMYDNIKNVMKPVDPFATSPNAATTRAPEPTFAPPSLHQMRDSKSTIVDFDPFSPKGSTPRSPFDFSEEVTTTTNDRLPSFGSKRLTQEEQRSQLGFSSESFAAASAMSATPKISLRDVNANAGTTSEDNSPYFLEGNDAFMSLNFANLDDFETNGTRKSSEKEQEQSETPSDTTSHDEVSEQCTQGEYDVRFENGRKLGVLMERVDVWNASNQRRESAVVKLVVENGAADRVGVSIGSTVVAINQKSVENETYLAILDLIKAATRPLCMRLKRGSQTKDSTQGAILTRISNGTFSVGNITSGNATWTTKYFAFGGSKMDVLQLFVSRAAYHECVIALYEKRGVHTQIQSFRLCRDHKISPIKCKIYKGYGNLHYFSLTVPSLRFVAAKFASDDYETIKNIWSNTFDAIERKKRMTY